MSSFGAILLFLCGTLQLAHGVNDEFAEGAKGVQVVDKVVDLIGQMCLLDNDIFLRRMANVETSYGNKPGTFNPGNNGGIWNIGEDLFKQTKNNPALTNEYNTIRNVLHIDWSTVAWRDLRKPMYSGIAATLLILTKNIQHIPESAELQATIWSVLRPGNVPFDFFQKTHNSISECSTSKDIDLVIVLDFRSMSTTELSSVRKFLDLFLRQLLNRSKGSKVAIVSKRGQPVASWYLNSNPGFDIYTALNALHFNQGPSTTGDMLDYVRNNMFTPQNGGRSGTAHVTLLLTDTVTQLTSAKVAAQKLENDGSSLIIVQVNNNTNTDQAQQLVSEPKCSNVKTVNTIADLDKVLERVDERVCRAPVLLAKSSNTHSCSSTMVAKLPDSSDYVSVKVTTTSGSVTLYASKNNPKPDAQNNDAHLVTTSGGTSTPVLFVRGTNPVYIRVEGQGQGNTCSGTYTVDVKVKALFRGKDGICFIADSVRPCSSVEMDVSTNDVVLLTDKSIPYLCNPQSHSIEYFPHPVDPKKFIMCDQHEQTYVVLCPVDQPPPNCLQLTSGCKYSNPCTHEVIVSGKMSQSDPCGDQSKYIECTQFGIAKLKSCPPGRQWNQDTSFCVFQYVRDIKNVANPDVKTIANPCIHSHADHVYFPYPGRPNKYILCDVHGNAFANDCPPNSLWNQQTKTCTMVSPVLG
ncbi:hypothetical protein ACF0H5_021892 [Mactra antiquata]